MRKTLTIIMLVSIAVACNLGSLKAQTCVTCPGNTVTGSSSSALGIRNTVSGNISATIGNNNIISSGASFIAGTYSIINSSSGNSAIVGGSNTIITASSESYIFGSGSVAQHTRAMLIGHRLKSGASNQIIIGAGDVGGFLTCNKMHSLAVGFNSNVPTFFVSETPSNLQSGRVGIGNNTDPQAKLHIKADAIENATLLLEATGKSKTSSFLMGGGNAIIGTTSNSNSLSFVTGNTNTRMFIDGVNGRIGIGTLSPDTELHIDGDITVSGLANEKGDQIVASDKNGKLLLIPALVLGDNLGNHSATQNLDMNEFSIRNSTKEDFQARADGSRYSAGLRLPEGLLPAPMKIINTWVIPIIAMVN